MNHSLNPTTHRLLMASVVGLATLLTVPTVDAQPRWGTPIAPQSGACFYRDVNFRGTYFCASVGEDVPMLSRGMNDQVSSIRTFGNAEVEVFQTERFVGRSAWFEQDVSNLMSTGWNDRVSSLRVGRAGRYGHGMNEARGGRNGTGTEVDLQPRWGTPRAPRSGACFYRDVNFRGTYFCANLGDDIPMLSAGMNDQISSIRTFGNAEVEVFQTQRFVGRSAWFGKNVRNLRSTGWNDQVSSIRVGRAGRYGRGMNEPRGGRDNAGVGRNDAGTRNGGRDGANGSTAAGRNEQEADATVRRVYQDILNREPDPTGMGIYRDRILNDRWSEQQVRDALMQSPEYRNRNVMTREKAAEIVAKVYRSELNRDPGAAAQGWVDKVLKENWTEAMLTVEIRKSPEYRNKR